MKIVSGLFLGGALGFGVMILASLWIDIGYNVLAGNDAMNHQFIAEYFFRPLGIVGLLAGGVFGTFVASHNNNV